MTRECVWHVCVCVWMCVCVWAWLVYMRDMTGECVWQVCVCVWMCVCVCERDSFICVTWRGNVCDMCVWMCGCVCVCVWAWLVHTCGTTRPYVCGVNCTYMSQTLYELTTYHELTMSQLRITNSLGGVNCTYMSFVCGGGRRRHTCMCVRWYIHINVSRIFYELTTYHELSMISLRITNSLWVDYMSQTLYELTTYHELTMSQLRITNSLWVNYDSMSQLRITNSTSQFTR